MSDSSSPENSRGKRLCLRDDTLKRDDGYGNDDDDDSGGELFRMMMADRSSSDEYCSDDDNSISMRDTLLRVTAAISSSDKRNLFHWAAKKRMAGVSVQTLLMLLSGKAFDDVVDEKELNLKLTCMMLSLSGFYIRNKLLHVNTFSDVVELFERSRNILIVTGAGISVSAGIPDFRSSDGIYASLQAKYPMLESPSDMFSISYFRRSSSPFFDFAREIFPGQFAPTLSHYFIKMLESKGRLLRNYTQNIDTLEQVAGITRLVQCHGSFSTATCMVCEHRVDGMTVKADIFAQRTPRCSRCSADTEGAILKPDIVFFGEPTQDLPETFHNTIQDDAIAADLVIVIGSSMRVQPVGAVCDAVPHDIPQILINREPLPHLVPDVELLGDCDVILSKLAATLGWNLVEEREKGLLCMDKVERLDITAVDGGVARSDGREIVSSTVDCGENVEKKTEMLSDSSNASGGLSCSSYTFVPPSRYLFEGSIVKPSDEEDGN